MATHTKTRIEEDEDDDSATDDNDDHDKEDEGVHENDDGATLCHAKPRYAATLGECMRMWRHIRRHDTVAVRK